MKSVQANVFETRIKVLTNGATKGEKWARIVDAQTGRVLHTGQVSYIRRTAKKRYNVRVAI